MSKTFIVEVDDDCNSIDDWISKHDANVRAYAIDEFAHKISKTFISNARMIYEIAEQIKEQKNEHRSSRN